MKTIRKIAGSLLTFALLLVMAAPAFAAKYTYTVRVFAGAQGTVDGGEVVTFSDLKYGDRVTFDINRVALHNDSKYYVRGIRESGRDNATVAAPSILVTGDIDYVVAYGIRGSTVAYTVNYQDVEGNTLLPSETYYGNVGDKPVVAFRYVEGYQPKAYNLTKTLSENAADNIFTFYYTRIDAGIAAPGATPAPAVPGTQPAPEIPSTEPGTGPVPALPGTSPDTSTGSGTGTSTGGMPDTTEPGTNVPDEDTPQGPAEIQDLDENPVPLAPGADLPGDETPEEPGMPLAARIAIAVGGAALLIAAVLLFFLRKKKGAKDNE